MNSNLPPPRPERPSLPPFGAVLIALHLVVGCGLFSVGSAFRIRGGTPLLVVGAWFVAVGFGLLLQKAWAWWSVEIGHPILVLGEVAVVVGALLLVKEGWKAPDWGGLGVIFGAAALLGALPALGVSIVSWIWFRRPSVRDLYLGTRATPGGRSGLGLLVAAAMLSAGAILIFVWSRGSPVRRPPGQANARSSSSRGAARRGEPFAGRTDATRAGASGTSGPAGTPEPCAGRFLSLSTPILFTPDSRRFVGAAGRNVCVWEAATGRLLAALESGGAASLAMAPDGSLLAALERTRAHEGRIVLWDLATLRRRSDFPLAVEGQRFFLAFGPTASILVAKTEPGTLGVYGVPSGEARYTWTGDINGIGAVLLSPDRRRVAFAPDGPGPVRVADVETGEIRTIERASDDPGANEPPARGGRLPSRGAARESRAQARIGSMLFSRDGATLYLERFQSVGVLDLIRGTARPALALPRSSRSGNLIPLSTTREDARLLTEMGTYLFPIFGLPGGALVTMGAPRVNVSRDAAPIFLEGKLASGAGWGRVVGVNGEVVSVTLANESAGGAYPDSRPASTHNGGSAVSPDGSILVLDIQQLSNLTLWDAATGAWIDSLSKSGSYGPMRERPVFSPDGRLLVACSSGGIDVWDLPARRLLYRIGGRDTE